MSGYSSTREVGNTTGGTWPIGELAHLSGVTSRTLRHYDAIGLLTPRGVGAGRRRVCGRGELLRLQQILVLRGLGVGAWGTSERRITPVIAKVGICTEDGLAGLVVSGAAPA